MRNAYKIVNGKPGGKRTLGKPRRGWEDNIRMDLREMGSKVWNGSTWHQWRALVNMVINLRVP